MHLSVVIPCYNEEESLPELLREATAVFDEAELDAELIVVDDGSSDASFERAQAAAEADPRIKLVRLRRNFGQTAAMVAGIDRASGDVIIPMDADRQNDPADIPRLIDAMGDDYDVVSGWRRERQDAALTRRLPSWLANRLISRITGVRLHDYGCTLKAYRREVMDEIRLYGEMHRFIPIHATWAGARVTELEVNHRSRTAGSSKYGLSRTFKVLLDLLTVTFLGAYSTKPLYLFGFLGMLLAGGGFIAGAETLVEKFVYGTKVHTNPVILLAVFLSLAGLQLVLIGLLAEILTRTYHEATGRPIYVVRETRNLPSE